MAIYDFMKEIDCHEQLLQTILQYKNEDGICRVSQAEIAKHIRKNKTYVAKAIHRLNAEDTCIEMIRKGEYIVHYTNIRDRGVFPKIAYLIAEMAGNPEKYNNEILIREKYNVTKKTVSIFTGYLSLIYK